MRKQGSGGYGVWSLKDQAQAESAKGSRAGSAVPKSPRQGKDEVRWGRVQFQFDGAEKIEGGAAFDGPGNIQFTAQRDSGAYHVPPVQ